MAGWPRTRRYAALGMEIFRYVWSTALLLFSLAIVLYAQIEYYIVFYPGVPNWLDKADNRWGILQMRFNKASDAPVPVVTKVKLAEVRAHLPKDTPVVTLEERRKHLSARREAAQLRRTW